MSSGWVQLHLQRCSNSVIVFLKLRSSSIADNISDHILCGRVWAFEQCSKSLAVLVLTASWDLQDSPDRQNKSVRSPVVVACCNLNRHYACCDGLILKSTQSYSCMELTMQPHFLLLYYSIFWLIAINLLTFHVPFQYLLIANFSLFSVFFIKKKITSSWPSLAVSRNLIFLMLQLTDRSLVRLICCRKHSIADYKIFSTLGFLRV